jgi:PAS domain S-box-containing protein
MAYNRGRRDRCFPPINQTDNLNAGPRIAKSLRATAPLTSTAAHMQKTSRSTTREADPSIERLRKSKEFTDDILGTVREGLAVLASDLKVRYVNPAFLKSFGLNRWEIEGKSLCRPGNEQWNKPELRKALEDVISQDRPLMDLEVEHASPALGVKTMVLNARRIIGSHSDDPLILLAIEDITARKQADAALRESEERYRTLFDLGPIAVYSCDASGVIRDFNRRAAELWGREPKPGDTDERWCGSVKLFRPDGSFLPHEQCPMAEVLSGRIPAVHDTEVQIEQADGSRITVSANILPLKNARGEMAGAINCFVDITDRKRNDEILRESEQKYRTLFDSIDEGFCIIEKVAGKPLDFRYIEANPAFASQAGASSVVGKTIRQAFSREPEEWIHIYDTILRTGEPKRFERDLVTRGRTLELFAFRVGDKDHRRVAVIFRDITSRKEAERAGSLLAAIVDSSDDAIVSKSLDGVITSWNKGAERLFGYAAEEAIGQNITLIVPPGRLQEEAEILDSVKRGKRVDHFETKRVRKDGTLLDVSVTISPVKDSSGRVVGASKVARGITERKIAEKALQEARSHLESMVEQRTESVRQLSLKLLTVQDEEHRHIARELHDSVVQDLAMIKISFDRLAHLKVPRKQTALLAQLSESLDKCLSEIRTISYLLHPPLIEELGFSAAAQWYLKGFSERSGIKVGLELSNESERLPRSVELPLFRILQASLSNVHRHAHSRSVDIRFAVTREKAQLEVKDYGNGIDPELLARFNRNGVGTGIGLAGMRERLREMGGRLEIESDAKGTLIRAVIPVAVSPETKRSESAL